MHTWKGLKMESRREKTDRILERLGVEADKNIAEYDKEIEAYERIGLSVPQELTQEMTEYFGSARFKLCVNSYHLFESDEKIRLQNLPYVSTPIDIHLYRLHVKYMKEPNVDIRRKGKEETLKVSHSVYRTNRERKMTKSIYEKFLSDTVGKPITVEGYEREFGFLKELENGE